MGDATLLIVFSVAEVVLLVVALIGSFLLVARRLRAIRDAMAEACAAVDALESELADVRPGARELNDALDKLAATLPGLNEAAERLALRRHRA